MTETTTAFDKQYFINLVHSILRHVFTGVGLWFTGNNIGDHGKWEFLLLGVASFLVGGAMILYSKYKTRVKFLTALAAKADTTEAQVDKQIAKGHGAGQI